ncbi:putative ser/thr protein phosphatase [Leptomonas seymouri]|uniref:Putative ser/thr protein phosphatase n=1 Tax=Leptomonas seymouri TaxID=5684 RepID=A0A0N0P4Q2_LEPSE|nr:putative ser/thr protein phosphatase [Leptomonas seymouri]|eukprot:KPI85569.1 putative ser/thr protein phosphatase [Leptomonas seymouri]
MSSNRNGNLMSQLSGLRLSDGSVVGSRASNTPPTLSTLSNRSSPTVGPPTGFPVGTTAIDPLGAKQGNQRPGLRVGHTEKETESPSSLTDKISRLIAQNHGSLASISSNASPSTIKHGSNGDSGSSIISSLAAQIHKSSSPPPSSGNACATTLSNPGTPPAASATTTVGATTRSSVALPKPRSAEGAPAAATQPTTNATSGGETLNPKVMEFFNTVAHSSRSPPPLADLKVAVAVSTAEQSSKKPTAARNARASPSITHPKSATQAAGAAIAVKTESKEPPSPSNRFLVDAFGHIDNLGATKPIIRSAPPISADARYIIVGDVHGCVDQLERLVEKVKYVHGKDCLFIIGDFVNKGPDSIGVVRACQRLGAYGVLGNHDYTLLRCCARMRRRPFTPDDLRDPVKRLAQKFPKDCEYYLRGLPHMVRIPRHNLLLVHAGLNLEHSLDEQNVEEIMHLRRLETVPNKPGAYKAIAKGMGGEPWGTLWKGPEMVIFGHDAFSGFQSHSHAYGIDTGCVYGDPLTCVVYGPDSVAGEFFSVPGLPKLENEMKGLPPPNSDIYEQHEMALEKLIIRPTSRATPAMSGSMGSRPVFLAAPLEYTEMLESFAIPASSASSVKAPSNIIATVTSTNTLMTPTSASPPRLVTPTCPTSVRLMETTTMNTREVQRSTLLALSATRELSAIAVLLGTPLYNNELEAMLSAEAQSDMAQQAFWIPFTRLVLVASAEFSDRSASELATMEAAVQFALDVCEEMEAVGSMMQPELAAFLARAREYQQWPKRIVKCVETLVI